MAAIGKIRQHYGLLIIIVGLALLAFVLGDLFKSTGRGRNTTTVAVVNGEKITYQEFNALSENNIEQTKRRNGGNLGQDENLNVRNQTLEQLVREVIMHEEMEDLGLAVSADELYDQFLGDNPNRYVVQNFSDADGNYNKEMVAQYLQNFLDLPVENRQNWLQFENAIREDRLNTKYNNLVKNSFYLPSKLAESMYNDKNEKRSVEVYAVRYNTIADSTVVVEASDKSRFFKENKNRFKTAETRSIDYVTFEIKPSEEDIEASKNYVAQLKNEFAASADVATFVNANSDKKYDSTWMGRKELPAAIEADMFEQEVGFTTEPYDNEGFYSIARLVARADRSDSLKAKHILVAYEGAFRSEVKRTKDEAKTLADSLLNVVKSGKGTILSLAEKFSDDPSAKENKGDLGWFTDGTMVPAFNEFVQNGKVGEFGVVETPFGFHVINITDRTDRNPKVRVAVIAHETFASSKTELAVFSEANAFVTASKNQESFDAAAEAQGLVKRTSNSFSAKTSRIQNLPSPRSVVKWAFDSKTKVGSVSNIIDLEGMYVVAILTDIVPEGFMSVDRVAERYDYQIKKEVKGRMLVEKALTYGNDYDKMIGDLKGEKVTVDDLTFSSRSFSNFGNEDKLIGAIAALKEGETSQPIAGSNAMFVVKVTKCTAAPAAKDYSSVISEKRNLFNNIVRNDGVYNYLKMIAEIKDNSLLFY